MAIEEFYAKSIIHINRAAKKDRKTNDLQYNRVLEEIRDFWYENVFGSDDVKYWCYCNNL